jgi:hypothetical protein
MTVEINPHREPPPCAKCEARAKAAAEFQPFVQPKTAGYYDCPACGADRGRLEFTYLCDGNKVAFTTASGYWFFGRRGRRGFVCNDTGARHYHLLCQHCHYRWQMVSKLDDEDDDDDE